MDIQASLKSARSFTKLTNCLNIRIQQLRELTGSTHSTSSEKSVGAKGLKKSRPESCALLLVELEETLQRESSEMAKLELVLRAQIKRIPNPKQRMVLELYYLCGQTFEQTAEIMGVSERWVQTLHKRGFKYLGDHCSS